MEPKQRRQLLVQGIVQGVGFRPFVYRLATELGLAGFVTNTPQGVEIEIEGGPAALADFEKRLVTEAPPLSRIVEVSATDRPPAGESAFAIIGSRNEAGRQTLISPDIALCRDCRDELLDPGNRRYRYPFINCTNCGPRFTIIRDIPYDRPATTMAPFVMCPECSREYHDPADRRFHAQPNACPVCGPRVMLLDRQGREQPVHDPLAEAGRLLREGRVLAVKGLGGFHLACDAGNNDAVVQLRERKHRYAKPLAVMAASLKEAASCALIDSRESSLLEHPRSPIVLLRKRPGFALGPDIAPGNRYIGVMLPYTPLHVLLMQAGPSTIVMTSGNLSDEPIACDNDDALHRLGTIADFFLVSDRDIYQRADDSVFQVAAGYPRPVRRSRGYVPTPVFLTAGIDPPVLAVGGELKNTICLTRGREAFLSQHIGDLETSKAREYFEETIEHLKRILAVEPRLIAHDLHPDYYTTAWAQGRDLPVCGVQHHHAHIASCLAENGRSDPVIGLALDGTGYGEDGAVWGGEVLIADLKQYRRAAHFEYRLMPGGDAAARDPWRMAVSLLHRALCSRRGAEGAERALFDLLQQLPFFHRIGEEPVTIVLGMLRTGINTVPTSSLGRLFDAFAAIAGLKDAGQFEGEAAMALEMTIAAEPAGDPYPFPCSGRDGVITISPDEAVLRAAADAAGGLGAGVVSRRFHDGLLDLFTGLCAELGRKEKISAVAMSGGCFQNRYLLEGLAARLEQAGFTVLTHRVVPANDGGLALGQAVIAAGKCK
ncbi:carbamoyltransferase HypF [bacterium]|nr:carbamoyltransferase HypF [bacterium]